MENPYYLTWLGHAALHLQIGTFSLYIDPYLHENPLTTFSVDVAQADYILVTHAHNDHLGDTVEIAKKCDSTVICNAEIAHWLRDREITAHGMQIGGGHAFPFGHVKMTQALHSSSLPDGVYGGNPGGFIITTLQPQEKKVYLAGDTGLFGDMRLIGEEGIDLAVLPIGDNYTMGPADALRAVKLLEPNYVIPIHYSTWGLIAQDANAWARQVEAETKTKAIVLDPGGSFPSLTTP